MPLPQIQQSVAQFVQQHGLETSVEARLLDLLSEVGELAKEVLKGGDYGKTGFTPTDDWEGELADALFSLICLANSTEVDLEAALFAALEKYRARLEEKGDAGSGR
ncbi:MAG: nucleotide pyrophosphohydrolase [Chloroflexi bacterium]|nr:nucleotide pyrophosphohydrolase [Chloroflexota bacterium]